tara:strand:- start:29 stop:346 length:318 start_codon:yes stop_codon:yes gene_type:complete
MTKITTKIIDSRGMEMKQLMLDLANNGYTHPSNADVAGSTVTDEVWAKAQAEELGIRPVANYDLATKNMAQVASDMMSDQSDYCHNTPTELDNIDLDDLSQQDIL